MPLNVDLINAGSILINGSPILDLYETGSGYCSTVRSGINSSVSGDCSVIAGGYSNTIIGISCASTISGGRFNTTLGCYTTIGGGRDNQSGTEGFVSGIAGVTYGGTLNNPVWQGPFSPSSGSTLSGYGAEFSFYFNGGGSVSIDTINQGSGYKNGDILLFNGDLFASGATPTDNVTFSLYVSNDGYATVGGGRENTASGEYSTISGGYENTASGYESTISGGYQNETRCSYSTVSGGYQNTVLGRSSIISGGYNNTVSGCYSIINGGYDNTVDTDNSAILGGFGNIVSHDCSFIVGQSITTSCPNTTYVNCLSIVNLPSSSAGLPSGSIWYDGIDSCTIKYVP